MEADGEEFSGLSHMNEDRRQTSILLKLCSNSLYSATL